MDQFHRHCVKFKDFVQGMNWVFSHAADPAALTKVMKPLAPPCRRLAIKKEAAVAEPAMDQKLEHAIVKCAAVDDLKTRSLCTAHMMAIGVVQFAHTRKPVFILKKLRCWWCK